jgi:hypothetical protein
VNSPRLSTADASTGKAGSQYPDSLSQQRVTAETHSWLRSARLFPNGEGSPSPFGSKQRGKWRYRCRPRLTAPPIGVTS